MLWRNLVPTRDLGNDRARRMGFRHDLRLDVVAPTTAPSSLPQGVNNIRNHGAIRFLHDGTHIASSPAYNKVGENDRLQSIDFSSDIIVSCNFVNVSLFRSSHDCGFRKR
jgi:hypothetical protein